MPDNEHRVHIHPSDPVIREIPVEHRNAQRITGYSDRVQRKLDNGKAAVAVQRKSVTVHVRIPRVCLPYADDRVKRKVRAHTLCLVLGCILATIGSFILGPWFAIHIAPGVPTAPGLAMEYLDRVRNR